MQLSFYFPKAQANCAIFLYNSTQCIDGSSLMLEKVTMQRTNILEKKVNETQVSKTVFSYLNVVWEDVSKESFIA